MAVSFVVSEIFNVENYHGLENKRFFYFCHVFLRFLTFLF